MRRWLLALLFPFALAVAAQAQEADAPFPEDADGGGFITRTIERQLSSENQTVHLVGFEGLLSSRASFRRLTIEDSEGVWLSIEGAELDWNRRALLRGEVQVNHLTAQRIELLRLPPGEGAGGGGVSLPSPTSTEVRLPQLPVGIDIGRIEAGVVHLGPAVLGETVEARVEGSARLSGGSGALVLSAERIDGRQGRLALDAAYDEASRALRLQVGLEEEAEGLLSGALGLPGRPALAFSIEGEGSIGDFSAAIRLTTDGVERVEGTLGFHDLPEGAGLGFGLRLAGDLAPLFRAPLRPFFGSHTELELAGQSLAAGGMRLDRLHFASNELQLEGSLELAADGFPRRFALEGTLAPAQGESVLLPLAGPETRLGAARLSAQFDETSGEAFRLDLDFAGFTRAGLAAETGRLSARGHLRRDGAQRRVTADLMLDLGGVDLGDPALTRAAGGHVFGAMVADWASGGGVEMRNLDLTAGAAHLLGEAQFSGLDGNLRVTTRSTLSADDLAPFSALAGRPLGGAAHASLQGFYEPLGGAFDLRLEAATRALTLGGGLVEALAGGDGTLSGRVARDGQGTTFDGLQFATPGMTGRLSGTLGPESGALTLNAGLTDFAPIHPGLPGPAEIAGTLGRAGADLRLDLTGKLPEGIALTVAGTAATDLARADVSIDATVPEAAALAPQLSGPLTAQGSVRLAEGVAELDLDTTLGAAPDARVQVSGSYRLAEATADLALRGTADLALVGPFTGGAVELDGRAQLDLRLDGPLAAEALSGSLTAQGVRIALPQAGITAPDAQLAVTLLPPAGRGPALLAAQVSASLPRIEAPGAVWAPLLAGPVTLQTRVGLQPGARLTVEALDLRNGDARLTGKAALGLSDGALDGRLGLSLPDLARLNPLLPLPLAGAATLGVELSRAAGATALEAQLSAEAGGLRLGPGTGAFALLDPDASLSLTARLDGDNLSLSDIALQNGAARLTGSAQAAAPDGEATTAQADLNLHLPSLARLQPALGMPLSGALDLDAQLGWDGAAATAQWSGRLAALSPGPGPAQQLLAGDATVSGRLRLADGALAVEGARFTNPALDLRADFSGGVLRFDARLDSLGRVIEAIPGPVSASGSVAPGVADGVRVTVHGPAGIEAQIAGTLSRAFVPDLRIEATAPLGLVNLFLGTGVNVQGRIQADLSLSRSLDLAGLAGTVTVSGGAVAVPGVSTTLQGLSGQAVLAGDTAQITAATGFNTSGRAELTATVGLTGAMPVAATARLLAAGVVQHPYLHTTLNGELHLNGAVRGPSSLTGQVALGETEISLNFGSGSGTLLDLHHLNEPAPSLATRERAGLLEEAREGRRRRGPPLSLDVTLSAPGRIFVRGRGLDAELGGELRLTGQAGAIIPIGGFELIRGRLDLLTRRLELTEGSIRLSGDFDPAVRLVAATSADGVAASIVVEGSISRPVMSITSTPPLPQEEVLALLLFGRHIQSISPIQALQLANAVRTLLSGGDGAQGRVRRSLGLDDLDLTEDASGNMAVRAGKYLSDNIYIDTVLSSDGSVDVQLNLDITPNLTARGTATSDGAGKLGIYFEKDY